MILIKQNLNHKQITSTGFSRNGRMAFSYKRKNLKHFLFLRTKTPASTLRLRFMSSKPQNLTTWVKGQLTCMRAQISRYQKVCGSITPITLQKIGP